MGLAGTLLKIQTRFIIHIWLKNSQWTDSDPVLETYSIELQNIYKGVCEISLISFGGKGRRISLSSASASWLSCPAFRPNSDRSTTHPWVEQLSQRSRNGTIRVDSSEEYMRSCPLNQNIYARSVLPRRHRPPWHRRKLVGMYNTVVHHFLLVSRYRFHVVEVHVVF